MKTPKIDLFIASIISEYPCLFYVRDWGKSRLAVLLHILAGLGTGYEYDPKTRGMKCRSNKKKLKDEIDIRIPEYKPKDSLTRIKNGDTMSWILTKTDQYLYRDCLFTSDLTPELLDSIKHIGVYLIEQFPDMNNKAEKEILSPPAFCFKYLPFVECNPHYAEKKGNLTVDELAESRKLLSDEWIDAIYTTYKYILNWFESDEFNKNPYFNLFLEDPDGGKDYFISQWSKAKQSPDTWRKFLIDYGFSPDKKFTSINKFLSELTTRNRNKYIREARLIVDAFSPAK